MNYSDDEITVALMMGTEISPERFELIPDCYWIESLRRATGQKDLFVYRHRKTEKFGLAQWSVKSKVFGQGVSAATEICLFSGPPGQSPPDLPEMEWLLWRCQPGHVVVEEGRQKRMQAISNRHSALLERKTILDDMAKLLRKQKLDEAADKLTLEDVPDEGQELDEMREMLNWAASGKIYSTG
jgi:hypothetical protein